jgi:hypothetical protein
VRYLIARFWPVDAVVGENGAFWMWHDDKAPSCAHRFVQSTRTAPRAERLLNGPRRGAADGRGGHRLATSPTAGRSRIDFCEDVPPLPRAESSASSRSSSATARTPRSARSTSTAGSATTTSSPPAGDDGELFGVDLERDAERYVFSGDSPNDSPMFGFFPNGVGVANVRDFADACRTCRVG